jgi:DNA-binding CsgD family transcriptional regulator/energy-coupling factor transporter ATP-binding protein EcfA2
MEPLATTMIGRDGEWVRLSAIVTGPDGQAAVLRGESGVGKSTLLDRAARLAERDGHGVVRAAGVEAESELPYAGLHQVLHPLLPRVNDLDEGSRAVLATVFGQNLGQSTGNPPSVMSLGIAVLDLLSLEAAQKPLLLLLDDGHWIDDASADVCGFVGRRLTGTSVRLVVALRADIESRFDSAALAEIPVPALSGEAAAQLLDQQHPELAPRIRELILDQAQGNPLALVELPAHIADANPERATAEELLGYSSDPLPRRLQRVYGTRIEALSDAVRRELLLGALDGVRAGSAIAPTVGLRYRMRDVDEAVAAGLLHVDAGTGDLVFRHPLVRSTVVQLSTPNQRRATHTVLADLHSDDVERRATHLAVATVDPDENVAAVLESAARSATLRGGAVSAVAWMTRAAELSENHQDRSRRLGDAAFIAGQTARLDEARRLGMSDVAPGGGESAASVVASAYVALYEDGDVRSSQRRVMAAVENILQEGPEAPTDMLSRLVNLLLAINQYASNGAAWRRTHQLLDAMGHLVPEHSRIYSCAWSDVMRHGAGVAERVEHAFAGEAGLEPWEITRLAVAAYHVDTLSNYRPHLQRTVEREVGRTGAVGNGMTMLHLIMLDQMALGEWDEAECTGQRALELTARHDYVLFTRHSQAYLALLAAMRGQVPRARELCAEVDSWARPRGVGFLTQITDAAGTVAALSEGDYESAYRHAIRITPPGTFEPYAHQATRTLLDLVEAAVHTGRSEQARRHALAARDAGLPDISPRLAVITYGALAMTADSEKECAEMYSRAETVPGSAYFPFELARIHLAHGTRLRHTQGPKAARHLLTLAADSFARLGAETWAERARTELRATGVSSSAAPSLGSLTWQERRIAELAAAGLTNKEIGERLHLSPRTVSSHLYRVFPKLGITARAALRDALGRSRDLTDA